MKAESSFLCSFADIGKPGTSRLGIISLLDGSGSMILFKGIVSLCGDLRFSLLEMFFEKMRLGTSCRSLWDGLRDEAFFGLLCSSKGKSSRWRCR